MIPKMSQHLKLLATTQIYTQTLRLRLTCS